jgi:hypothetical protein
MEIFYLLWSNLIFVCNHNAQAINKKYEIYIFINSYELDPIIGDYLRMVGGNRSFCKRLSLSYAMH